MRKAVLFAAALLLGLGQTADAQTPSMNFFLTSAGSMDGANLGGLAGADEICHQLAYSAGFASLTWRAYLSTAAANGRPAVNARDRIGRGPWYNRNGVMIAENLEQLHGDDSNLNKETALTEHGRQVNGRGDDPNQHDVLTGSLPDGTAADGSDDTTCSNWTSNGAGSALVGHHDRQGGGANPTSWNSAHGSRGCSQHDLVGTGGNGYFYCFGV
ncbi:MAG TPA: hypothetical protein VMN39_07480 [Longimicrobiaceae bacterium]|nr:hypothetical protein [Longimicrobiaceae bacterium]